MRSVSPRARLRALAGGLVPLERRAARGVRCAITALARGSRGVERVLPARLRAVWTLRLVGLRARLRRQPGLVSLPHSSRVLVLAMDADAAALRRCVEAIEQDWDDRSPDSGGSPSEATEAVTDRLRPRRTTPLIVTDCDAFAWLRDRGVPFEYIPARGDIEGRVRVDYDPWVGGRLADLMSSYGLRHVVEWTDDSAALVTAMREVDEQELSASRRLHWRARLSRPPS